MDLSLLKHKADRSFCEALLSRFSIEVGRRVSELEVQQQQLVYDIQAREDERNAPPPMVPHPHPTPAGVGVLRTSYYSTGDIAPERAPTGSFQPRRQLMLTPGEARLADERDAVTSAYQGALHSSTKTRPKEHYTRPMSASPSPAERQASTRPGSAQARICAYICLS